MPYQNVEVMLAYSARRLDKPCPRFVWVSVVKSIQLISYGNIDNDRFVQVKVRILQTEYPRICFRVSHLSVGFSLRFGKHFRMSNHPFTSCIEAYPIPRSKMFSSRCPFTKGVNLLLTNKTLDYLFGRLFFVGFYRGKPVGNITLY